MNCRIIVADDHEVVRMGVKFALAEQESVEVVAEASSYGELMQLLASDQFDCLILDLNLGDSNGFGPLREIKTKYEQMFIVVLSSHPNDPYALMSIQAGAHGYLNKGIMMNRLVYAIDEIRHGNIFIEETYRETLPYGTSMTYSIDSPLATLSDRELEVCQHLVAGLTQKEISQKLSLSPKTISTYKTRILDKLSLKNTGQLIRFVLQESHDL